MEPKKLMDKTRSSICTQKNAYVKKPPKKMKEKDNYYSSQKQTNKKGLNCR